jgi:cytochrome c-type biogenesis protein CcmH/NrfF
MGTLDTLLTWSHILGGALVLLSGMAAMLVQPKGGRLHKRVGLVYFYGMLWVAVSAVAIISFFRFNLFLLVIAIFSFYQCFSGYRVLRRKRPGQQTWIDWSGAIIALLAGIVLLIVGINGLHDKGVHPIFILCLIFGLMTALSAWADMRIFRRTDMPERMWWWYHHMQAMIGSYIAAFTAFVVQNGERLPPDLKYGWLLWLAPTLIGTPVIFFWIGHYRKKFKDS